MPRVSTYRVAQGYRPFANPKHALAGLPGIGYRRLSGLGDGTTFSGCVQAYDANGNPVVCGDPSAAVWVDASGNAVPPGTAVGVSAAIAAVPPAPPAAGAPTGAYLTYTATWPITLTKSFATVMSAVQSFVAQYGLKVTNSSNNLSALSLAGSFQVTIQLLVTGSGFVNPNDAGSIVDHAFYTAAGVMPLGSTTVVAQLPSGAGTVAAPPAAGAQSITSWLEDNALYIGLGIAVIVLLPRFL